MKRNKYNYLYVLQGDYGYGEGFEDLCQVDKKEKNARKIIKEDKKAYVLNSPEGRYRIITRRELNED